MLTYKAYSCCIILSIIIFNTLHPHSIFDQLKTINATLPPVDEIVSPAIRSEEKEYTFAVYIAARNDLARFVARNLLEMMQVGTNEHLTILVHLDSVLHDNTMVTQRFIVYKNRLVQVDDMAPMDSGRPDTLTDFCTWAFTHFPSRQPMLTLWSHGIGDLELDEWIRAVSIPHLYMYNPQTKLIEINRTMSFLECVTTFHEQHNLSRGICFDDITGHCLTNHEIGKALETVRDTCLQGEPLACLLCDACLMNSIGFIFSLKPYQKKPVARMLIGSQEAVLATGYDYYRTLEPLSHGAIPLADFADHVTQTFAQTYSPIVRDYAQSAIVLESLDPLYEAIDAIAHLLMDGLGHQEKQSVENFIEASSSRKNCTFFAEPSYKDMHHLFANMRAHLEDIVVHDPGHTQRLRGELAKELDNACSLIRNLVVANKTGANLKDAAGISIYMPKKRNKVHYSYQQTDFGKQSAWFDLLTMYTGK